MGILVTNARLDDVAPDYNSSGVSPVWAGRRVSELTTFDVVQLLDFAASEGARRGWNAGIAGENNPEHGTPFSAGFLGGWPDRVWRDAYADSYHQAQARSDA